YPVGDRQGALIGLPLDACRKRGDVDVGVVLQLNPARLLRGLDGDFIAVAPDGIHCSAHVPKLTTEAQRTPRRTKKISVRLGVLCASMVNAFNLWSLTAIDT